MHQTKISMHQNHIMSPQIIINKKTVLKKSTNNAPLNYNQTLHMKIPIFRNSTKILPKSYTPVI